VSGDTNGNEIFDPGEIWIWEVTFTIYENTHFETWGHGIDPLGGAVDYPEFPSEYADITIKVDATRTQGFWASHFDYTSHIFTEHLGGSIDLGWVTIDSIEDLFGMFYANLAKTADGDQRCELNMARVKAAQQALAAILNSALDNDTMLPSGYSLGEIAAILGGDDIDAINELQMVLDAYNNSNDDVEIEDDDGTPIGTADPKAAKEIADITIADEGNCATSFAFDDSIFSVVTPPAATDQPVSKKPSRNTGDLDID
jgi:hypothetical protein